MANFDDSSTLLTVRRVAKVTKGGTDFNFSAAVVAGDGNGAVAVGISKSKEVPVAIKKSSEQARRNLVKVNLAGDTIQRPITMKYGAAEVYLQPAAPGTGLIAGGAVRAVLEAAGVKDIISKNKGSSNPINVAKATIMALQSIESPEQVAARRGKTVEEII